MPEKIKKKATLINPKTKKRKVVDVGDRSAFEGGFKLEGKTKEGTPTIGEDVTPFGVSAEKAVNLGFNPGNKVEVSKTIDTDAEDFTINKDKSAFDNGAGAGSAFDDPGRVTTQPIGEGRPIGDEGGAFGVPELKTGLTQSEQKQADESLAAEVKQFEEESAKKIDEIRAEGKVTQGVSKGFLAKIGGLGRTVSGAPLDTNLGVLSFQNNLMKDLIKEERVNLEGKIAAAKTGSAAAIEDKISKMNEIIQQNFDNAIKLAQEDRASSSEDRADRLAELQGQKFQFEIGKANADLDRESAEDALGTIKLMAESDIPLTAIDIELANELEDTANLPRGIFAGYFSALKDAKNLQTEENIAKVDKIKQDIINGIENVKIAKKKAETSAFSASVSAGNLATRREELEIKKTEAADKETKTFYSDIQAGQDNLLEGKNWAQTWNKLFGQYSTGDEKQDEDLRTILDDALDKETFSKEGAFQEFKKSTDKGTTPVLALQTD